MPVAILNGMFHGVRYVVAFAHRDGTIYLHMKIDIETESHFANQQFFNLNHTRHGACSVTNDVDNLSARRSVHNFEKRGAQQPIAIHTDQATPEKPAPLVRALPSSPADDRTRKT